MKKSKITAMILSVLLLATSLFSCGQSEQDKLYDELTAKSSTPPSEISVPEESASSQEAVSSEGLSAEKDSFLQKLEWDQLFDIEPNTELSGTLTIGVDSSKTLEPWIKAFQAVYPNVEIKTKLYPMTSEKAIDSLIVHLNSGEAGDIVYLSILSLFKYGESGLFVDLYPFIDADPDISREDFYPNVLKALETSDGRLCTVCPAISIENVYFNTSVTDPLGIDFLEEYPDGMDYKDVVDLYWRCIEEGALDEDAPLSAMGSKDYLSTMEIMAYLDEVTGECHFDSPEHIEFLKTTNSIPAGVELYCDGFSIAYPLETTSEFMMVGSDCFSVLHRYQEPDEELHNTPWMPTKATNGKKQFEVELPLGITSACQNQELAWEFIKFILSEKEFPEKPAEGYNDPGYRYLYGDCIPFNRKNFENLFKAYYDDEELFQYLDQLYSQRDVVRFMDGRLNAAWEEAKRNYYQYELISAEECAKQMQERTWIYMNE